MTILMCSISSCAMNRIEKSQCLSKGVPVVTQIFLETIKIVVQFPMHSILEVAGKDDRKINELDFV